MGIRFRKRISLAPGLRLNVSGSGLSLSVGPRGASMTLGSRGTYLNVGIPGTGLYSRERIGPTHQSSQRSGPGIRASSGMSVTITVQADGTVVFTDSAGLPLDERLIRRVKAQHKDEIHELMKTACAEINERIEALEQIHLATPAPDDHPVYTPRPYDAPVPTMPEPRKHGILGTLFGSIRARIDQGNAAELAAYESTLREWTGRKQEHEAREHVHKNLIECEVLIQVAAMETVLEESLKAILWPRETSVSSEVREDGRLVMVDIDLPEIEEMPRQMASMPTKGYKLSVRELSVSRLQQLYMRHVHGIGFRIIGEIFYVLPKAEQVVLSAYSQRPNKATGVIEDQYLYSVRVARSDWATISFVNLSNVDVVEALGRFDMRREITKSGLLREIRPFEAPSPA